MAGPYGEAGKEYWERSKNSALTSLKNNAPKPFTIPAPIQINEGESAVSEQSGSSSVDLSKIDFSQFGKEPEAPKDERNFFQKAVEAPVIKQVLDAISVFNYAGANIANNVVDTTEQVMEGKFDGNPLKAAAAYIGDPLEGIGQGLSGAFGGNKEDARGYGSVIRRAQENITGDTESTAAKWVSGLGGFAGDVLLDPTTYIGVGAIKGIVKGGASAAKYGKSEKLAKEMASNPAMAEAANVTRTFVPGKYLPNVQAKIDEVASKRSTFAPLDEADALKFDGIRPSRKTVEVQKVENSFAPNGNVSNIRAAATGRADAFKAAYADTVNNYRLTERSRKLTNRDKRAARAEYKRNPDAAIARVIMAPYQNLVSVANTSTPTAAIAVASDIVRNADDIMGVTRTADDIKLDAADLVEAAKQETPVNEVLDAVTGVNTADKAEEIPGQGTLFTPNEVREGARVDAVERVIGVERTHADTRNTGYTSDDFWNDSPIPGQQSFDNELGISSNGTTPPINGAPAIGVTGGIDEVVNAGVTTAKPVRPVTPEEVLQKESQKPGNVSPQEVERAAENYTDAMNRVLSTPEGVRGMKLRSIKEQQAQDVAFIMARAELPQVARDPDIRAMRSTFFYPKHTIDAARKLNAVAKSGKMDPTVVINHFMDAANGGIKSDSAIKAAKAVIARGNAAEITAFAKANKAFLVAMNRAKAGVPNQAYISLGVHPSDVKYAKDNALQSTVMVDQERSFTRLLTHMRNLANATNAETRFKLHDDHPLWRTVEELEDVFNVVGVQEVVKALRGVDRKSAIFKEAEKFAIGSRVPNAAHRGISQLVGEDTIRASLKLNPVSPEIMSNITATLRTYLDTIDPGFSKFVDEVIVKRAKIQATPVGKNRTTRTNSSTDGAGKGARTNDQWNTHALMGAYQDISNKIYKDVHSKNMKKKDELTMAAMRYFDNTLREQGIDFHLTDHSPLRVDVNGKATGEITVRLGLSDILDAIGPELRAQFWHAGTMKLLPSQLLGLGEDLVRSARHIDPITGSVDINRARLTVAMGLRGTLGSGRVWESGGSTRLIGMDEAAEDIAREGGWVNYREVIENSDNDARRYMLQTAVSRYLNDIEGKRLISREEANQIFAKGATKAETRVYDDVEADVIARLTANEFDGASLLKNAIDEMNGKVDELVEALFKAGSDGRIPFNKIVETAIDNSMLVGKNITDAANKFAKADVARIEKALLERNSSDLITAVTTESKALNGLAPEVRALTTDAKAESIAKALTPDEVNNIKVKAKTAKTLNSVNANEARVKNLSDPEVNADDIVAATKAMPQVDAATAQALQDVLYDAGIKSTAVNVSRAMGNWGPRFNPTSGFESSASLVTASTHTISALMDSVTKQFQAWKKVGVNAPELNISLNVIKNTVKSGGDLKTLSGVDKEVYEYFNILFDTSKYNFFTSNGIMGAAMNRFKFNLSNSFGDTTKGLIKFDEETSVDEISRLWTQLPINDPYSFTSKLFYVYAKTVQETTVAAEFSRNFGKVMSPEAAKTAGYVKIVDVNKKNIFSRMIDGDRYYPREMADEVVHINRMMETNRAIANQQMQTFMENVWDPVISVLKMGQTSIKPGHHVMSVMGDWWRNLMLTGSPMTHEYKQAAKMVMYLRQMRKNEQGVDTLTRRLDAAMGNEFNIKGDISEIVLSVYSAKHKKVMPTKFNMAELVTLGEKHGVFFAPHSGGVSEDLLSGASAGVAGGKVKAVTDKLLDNKMTGAINKFSADRDGLMRGALFLHYMQSKRFSSLEEAANFAGDKVRKAAPVAADLAAWESKYMRRGVFYYTWLRGITPRILETLITKPGLAMIPSKGMYELAEANGLDPNSFGDPMSDELKSNLPDYYSERVMGPAYRDADTGDYWGFSSTSPTIDVLNTFGSNIAPADFLGRLYDPLDTDKGAAAKLGQTFVGMVTPWAKYPIELATGKRMDTGAPIESNLQYLQDQNAVSRTISKVTGKNLDGLNRTEAKYRDGMEDPGAIIGNELTNFFSGIQSTNYSAPNVQKAAEFQTKEEASQLKKLLDRMGQGGQ